MIYRGILGLSGTINCSPWDPTANPCFHCPLAGEPHSYPFSHPWDGPGLGAWWDTGNLGDPCWAGHGWPRTGEPERCMSSGLIPVAG